MMCLRVARPVLSFRLAVFLAVLPVGIASAQATPAGTSLLSSATPGQGQSTASAQADTEDVTTRSTRALRRAAREAVPASEREVGSRLRPTMVWRRPAMLATLLALSAALLLAMPIVAVYRFTTPTDRYDAALAQSIFILPATVAGIVLVIQGSLALAFSLAGVVTTVRFRSALKDTNDAAYIFLAVAIGVAAGAEAVDIAAVLALFFSAVMVLLCVARRHLLEREASLPSSTAQPAQTGEHHGKSKHADEVVSAPSTDHRAHLVVRAPNAEVARQLAEPLLGGMAKSWALLQIVPDAAGVTLTYEVRLRKSGDPLVLARAISLAGDEQHIVATVGDGAEPGIEKPGISGASPDGAQAVTGSLPTSLDTSDGRRTPPHAG